MIDNNNNAPPEPLRRGANLFERLDYLVRAAFFLIIEALSTRFDREAMMASVQELQSALDRNTAATTAAGAAISTEIEQLKAAIAALSTAEPPTQAQLDQLSASSDALEAATAALTADDPTAA